MKPKIKQMVASKELGIVEVQFQEPKSGVRACLADLPGVHLMYVAEIIPPAATAVEAFESKYVLEGGVENGSFSHIDEAKKDVELGTAMAFPGLRPLGQVFVQFMMVWHLYTEKGSLSLSS